jgi:hypothetical protein
VLLHGQHGTLALYGCAFRTVYRCCLYPTLLMSQDKMQALYAYINVSSTSGAFSSSKIGSVAYRYVR